MTEPQDAFLAGVIVGANAAAVLFYIASFVALERARRRGVAHGGSPSSRREEGLENEIP